MFLRGNKPLTPPAVLAQATTGAPDLNADLKAALIEPVFASQLGQAPVFAFDDAQNPINVDDIFGIIATTLGDQINDTAEKEAKSFYAQAWTAFNPASNLLAREAYLNYAARMAKLPDPSPTCIYTVRDDVIPSAKSMLAQSVPPEHWLASLGFYVRGIQASNLLAFSFQSERVFEQFKNWFATRIATWPNLPQNRTLFTDFQKLKLDGPVEAVWLRKTHGDPNADAENSFARVLVRSLFDFVQSINDPYQVCALPFELYEMIEPTAVAFVNVEVHAKSKPSVITDEWQLIAQAKSMAVRMVSNNKLSKLSSMPRQLKKAAALSGQQMLGKGVGRTAEIPFSGTRPPTALLIKRITKLLNRMGTKANSTNITKQRHRSCNVPSRRRPDDIDAPGWSNATIYRPDLHLYIDTSGSISEENYRDAILSAIAIARKLNLNLYFNSFSHVISECTYLPTAGRSVAQIYNQFRRVPKVDGGTDYAQVWNYINADKNRRQELSLIISDFEYYPPTHYIEHPKNLYYAPCSALDWNYMVHWATKLTRRMKHIDPNFRKRILM